MKVKKTELQAKNQIEKDLIKTEIEIMFSKIDLSLREQEKFILTKFKKLPISHN